MPQGFSPDLPHGNDPLVHASLPDRNRATSERIGRTPSFTGWPPGKRRLQVSPGLEPFRLCILCLRMRPPPSSGPGAGDQDVYLVRDNFGALDRSWREADEAEIDRETTIIVSLTASI